ncbi:sigma-70 family RNA polymerase sigma factor [Clostridium psychrophilum]|uniref:sigma-70 family RNA polymerase sigma factor n=1 Tax=Clostridium psychrophilum TaxID=132926 RepID=UPI001C0B172B|nr:sigma-70 family RNA polymerase sigma factor [Clostridium psychrophilum]MBU3182888.1 sigma-70 family RNA polymerase sigma factor [Clostridium psychrophilum]
MNSSIIVNKTQKQDDEAFSKLINTYKEKLYCIAFSYLKNEQNSLDAVNETVYKAYMNLFELKMPQFFKTWIIRILINCCKDILKVDSKVIYIDDYNKVDEYRNKASEIEFKIDSSIDLYTAIDKLNRKFKRIVILKYLEDMTIIQISEILNLPEGTVKVYLRRALSVLKIKLGEECM